MLMCSVFKRFFFFLAMSPQGYKMKSSWIYFPKSQLQVAKEVFSSPNSADIQNMFDTRIRTSDFGVQVFYYNKSIQN